MTMYATKLEHIAGVLPEIVDEGAHISVEDYGSGLPLGWALKSAGVTRKEPHSRSEELSYWRFSSWGTHWAKGRSHERFESNAKGKAQWWLQYLWQMRLSDTTTNSRIFPSLISKENIQQGPTRWRRRAWKAWAGSREGNWRNEKRSNENVCSSASHHVWKIQHLWNRVSV